MVIQDIGPVLLMEQAAKFLNTIRISSGILDIRMVNLRVTEFKSCTLGIQDTAGEKVTMSIFGCEPGRIRLRG